MKKVSIRGELKKAGKDLAKEFKQQIFGKKKKQPNKRPITIHYHFKK